MRSAAGRRVQGGHIDKHAYWLSGLLSLFAFRVFAQLLQAVHPVGWLPPFSEWQGSSLPYPALLTVQLLIILVLVNLIRKIGQRRLAPDVRIGRVFVVLGGIYFTVMLLRLLLGLTLLASVPWFAKSIPAFFHLVLASMLLLIGHYHSRGLTAGRTR